MRTGASAKSCARNPSIAVNFGGVHERAIEAVGPSVISAAKQLARAATLGRRSGAMAADVIEAAQFPIDSAYA